MTRILFCCAFLLSLSAFSHADPTAALFGQIEVTKLIVMPDASGHTDWVDAIGSAKKYVHMTMYHITDKAVASALTEKAKDSGVEVQVIVDGGSLKGGYLTVFNQLQAAGVQIRASSNAFSLTHSKDLVIDGKSAIVSAINMTNTATNSRDFGIVTTDTGVIDEIESVFAVDWTNAQSGAKDTPTLSNPNLVWSPTTSDNRLVALIDSANSTLVMESESFDATDIIDALNRAAARGVTVRLIVPECDLGSPLFNYPFLAKLIAVNIRVEHDGNSVAQPYMHSKMMLVDGKIVYVGSINFTFNSILNDRELGIIFTNATTSAQLAGEFEVDWNRSLVPATNPSCSAASALPSEDR